MAAPLLCQTVLPVTARTPNRLKQGGTESRRPTRPLRLATGGRASDGQRSCLLDHRRGVRRRLDPIRVPKATCKLSPLAPTVLTNRKAVMENCRIFGDSPSLFKNLFSRILSHVLRPARRLPPLPGRQEGRSGLSSCFRGYIFRNGTDVGLSAGAALKLFLGFRNQRGLD